MKNKLSTPPRLPPPAYYALMVLYTLLGLVIRGVTLLPLWALIAFPQGSPWQYGALLFPILFIFLLLPLRFSFAEALVQSSGHRRFPFKKALNLRHYRKKLSESARHALNILKWGLPLIAVLGYVLYWAFKGDIGLLRMFSDLGKAVTPIWGSMVNFIRMVFGVGEALTLEGGLLEGVIVLLVALILSLLPLYWGVARNSANRYIWAHAFHDGQNPRQEINRRLRGNRLRQLLFAGINLVMWAPFFICVYSAYSSIAMAFSGAAADMLTLMMYMRGGQLPDLPSMSAMFGPLLLGFFLLYIPLLPLRRYVTTRFAMGTRRGESGNAMG